MKRRVALTDAESESEFQRVSKDLLEHQPGAGMNYWAGFRHPTMLVWAGRIFDFLRAAEQVMGFVVARRQSYLVGYRSGWDGAEVNSGLLGDVARAEREARLLDAGIRILAGAGWGRCEVEFDDDAGVVRWTFPQGTAVGVAALADGARQDVACPFVAGYLAGWTNRALNLRTEFKEVECVARGQPRCVFESTEFLRFRGEAGTPGNGGSAEGPST